MDIRDLLHADLLECYDVIKDLQSRADMTSVKEELLKQSQHTKHKIKMLGDYLHKLVNLFQVQAEHEINKITLDKTDTLDRHSKELLQCLEYLSKMCGFTEDLLKGKKNISHSVAKDFVPKLKSELSNGLQSCKELRLIDYAMFTSIDAEIEVSELFKIPLANIVSKSSQPNETTKLCTLGFEDARPIKIEGLEEESSSNNSPLDDSERNGNDTLLMRRDILAAIPEGSEDLEVEHLEVSPNKEDIVEVSSNDEDEDIVPSKNQEIDFSGSLCDSHLSHASRNYLQSKNTICGTEQGTSVMKSCSLPNPPKTNLLLHKQPKQEAAKDNLVDEKLEIKTPEKPAQEIKEESYMTSELPKNVQPRKKGLSHDNLNGKGDSLVQVSDKLKGIALGDKGDGDKQMRLTESSLMDVATANDTGLLRKRKEEPLTEMTEISNLSHRPQNKLLQASNPRPLKIHFTLGRLLPWSTNGAPGINARHLKTLIGSGSSHFGFPIGCCVRIDGRLVVADTGNNLVKVLMDDNLEMTIGKNDGIRFVRPSAIVTDSAGNIYVKDNLCIQIFDIGGNHFNTVGKRVFQNPYGLALAEVPHRGSALLVLDSNYGYSWLYHYYIKEDKLERYQFEAYFQYGTATSKLRFFAVHKDRMLTSDLGSSVMYLSHLNGKTLRVFGSQGHQPGNFFEPSGVAADGAGNWLVGDSKNNRVQVFNHDGDFVALIKFQSPIRRPSGIHLTPDGTLYVINYLDKCIKAYQLLKAQ